MAVLARKVSPAEFGLIGVAAIWNTFLHLFLELGLGAALVQRKEITPGQPSVAITLNLAAGILLTGGSFLAAGTVASLLRNPEAEPVIASLSTCFFITSAASTHIALAQRDLRFKELAVRDFIANLIAILIGIGMALAGFGVWAVVASSIILNLLNAVFVWSLATIRVHRPTTADFQAIFPFGIKVFLYTGLKHVLRSIDSIAVGFLFGAERLGLYNFANRITAAPTKALQIGLASFLFPRASRAQHDPEQLIDLFWLAFKTLAYPMALFSLALVAVGTDLIILIFGAQWSSAIVVIYLLLAAQFGSVFIVPFAEILKATGNATALLTWATLLAASSVASLSLGSFRGFEFSLIAFVGATWLFAAIAAIVLGVRFRPKVEQLWVRLRPFLFLSGAAVILFFLVSRACADQLLVRALAVSLLGLAYAAAAFHFDSDIRRIVHLLRSSRRTSRRSAVA